MMVYLTTFRRQCYITGLDCGQKKFQKLPAFHHQRAPRVQRQLAQAASATWLVWSRAQAWSPPWRNESVWVRDGSDLSALGPTWIGVLGVFSSVWYSNDPNVWPKLIWKVPRFNPTNPTTTEEEGQSHEIIGFLLKQLALQILREVQGFSFGFVCRSGWCLFIWLVVEPPIPRKNESQDHQDRKPYLDPAW